jgi:hypothetical protein
LFTTIWPVFVVAKIESNTTISNTNAISVKYSYGNYYLLPSLASNSDFNLLYDNQQHYTDIGISYKSNINQQLTYSGAVEITDLPHALIGTNYSRPDYILSTGRFQESKICYENELINIQLGRTNFFSESSRSKVFTAPISGDGISWAYSGKGWQFNHVIASLPAEKSEGTIYRRVVNYHHLSFRIREMKLGAGEYFILTGPVIGIDFKRLNPFIPYTRNSHDSYRNIYSGFIGDSDNSIIKFFIEWSNDHSNINLKLYIDEFQIDASDRKILNDAILLNTRLKKKFGSFAGKQIAWTIEGMLSLASPNFGEHPGPFTTATSAKIPLFEGSPGMTSLFYLKSELSPQGRNRLSISWLQERWVNISSLEPDIRNQRALIQTLTSHQDSQLLVSFSREYTSLHTSVLLEGWWVSSTDDIKGAKISIMYNYSY